MGSAGLSRDHGPGCSVPAGLVAAGNYSRSPGKRRGSNTELLQSNLLSFPQNRKCGSVWAPDGSAALGCFREKLSVLPCHSSSVGSFHPSRMHVALHDGAGGENCSWDRLWLLHGECFVLPQASAIPCLSQNSSAYIGLSFFPGSCKIHLFNIKRPELISFIAFITKQ